MEKKIVLKEFDPIYWAGLDVEKKKEDTKCVLPSTTGIIAGCRNGYSAPTITIVDEETEKKVKDVIKYCKENGIDLTNAYKQYFTIGLSIISAFGEAGRKYFHELCQIYVNYSYEECDKKYDELLRSTKGKISIGTLFYLAKMAGYSEASTTDDVEEGFFIVTNLNDAVKKGKEMSAPEVLIKNVVTKGETTILFGDTGVGKTILSYQMANQIAREHSELKILYINFELTFQQLAGRFGGIDIPNNLYNANVDYSKMNDPKDQSSMMKNIEKAVYALGADIIFIDNMSNLCINSKEGADAGKVMLDLIKLRHQYNWTMIILAHVPKRDEKNPLSINDLAGSKMISNFADNVIGLNKSIQDSNIRYLKQLKCRSNAIEWTDDNIQLLTLATEDNYLHFVYGETDKEFKHLPRTRDEKEELEKAIMEELQKPNRASYDEIARKFNTNKTKVSRVYKKMNK